MVVEAVLPHGAGARAGLEPGDILLSYRRAPAPPANPQEASGAFDTCRAFAEAEAEQSPRGPIELTLLRDGRRLERALPQGAWQVQVRPLKDESPEAAAWKELNAAQELTKKRSFEEAHAAFARALAHAEPLRDPFFHALIHERQGLACLPQRDFERGAKSFHEAVRLRRQVVPGTLAEAALWFHLGKLEQGRRQLGAAEEALQKALALQARQAPGSLVEANTYRELAAARTLQGNPAEAESFATRALERIRQLHPGSDDEAHALNKLAIARAQQGELQDAEELFRAAGEILRRVDPQGENLTYNRANLGGMAVERGDYARAEELFQEALARLEKVAPESLEVAGLLNNLGNIARERYDLSAADAFYRRALALRQKLAPGSLDEARSLSTLAIVALDRKNVDEAERFARRAFEIRRERAPKTLDMATSLLTLGRIAQRREDFAAAEKFQRQALAVQREGAPGVAFEAQLVYAMGDLYMEMKDWPRAEKALKEALSLWQQRSPTGFREAHTGNRLGQLYEKTGRLREAETRYAAAVAAVEGHIGRVGGGEDSQASFLARFQGFYQDLIRVELARGEPALALQTQERSRGRALLRWLAQRDLAFGGDVPAELSVKLRQVEQAYEKTQAAMARPAAPGRPAAGEVRARLFALRTERVGLMQKIAQASPRYAALKDPTPLDLGAIRKTLDPGTVWLSYGVLPEETLLFVVSSKAAAGRPDGFTVLRLPVGKEVLEREVSIFRSLVLRPGGQGLDPALVAAGQRLYRMLISPAAAEIANAERVLVSPDGPLHVLPFAALIRPGPSPTFLIEEKPLHSVLSATVYAELRSHRRPAGPGNGRVVAFADPVIPRQEKSPSPTRGDRADGSSSPWRLYRSGLSPLPGGRAEAQVLASLYGSGLRAFEGAAATEAEAKKLGPGPRLIHFACHALLDSELPLDSALALAPGKGSDNGLLQAWEIFDQLRLDADLVTLSACSTGLGKSTAGEGLIGLTRAFQYAGARSVLASLWEVSDRSTAELMKRFYTALSAGRSKDVALAEAQRALLRSGNAKLAHPASWAGFELIGDWR